MAHLNRMPKKNYAYFLLFFIPIFLSPSLLFAENEPNNSIETANTMELNGSISGTFSASDYSYDYFKLVVPSDGKLTISVSADAGLCVGMYLLSETGLYTIATNGNCGFDTYSNTITFNNLAAGTYNLEAGNSGYGNYTISNTFVATSLASDSEFNDNIENALEFSLNSVMVGHLGFRSIQTDYYDYYKLTTTSDGTLKLYVDPDPTLCIDLTVYSETGLYTLYYNGYCSAQSHSDTLIINNLKAGTYMIATSAVGYGSYKISNEFLSTALPNDLEPNDNLASALSLPINSAMTGHLGYRSLQTDDYKISTSVRGRLKVMVDAESTLCVNLNLISEDGNFYLSSNGSCGNESHTDSMVIENLAAGNYYVLAAGAGYGTYTISTSLGFVSGLNGEISTDIEVFPNPVKNELCIATKGLIITGIKIYDLAGRIQFDKNISFNRNLQKIDLKSLRTGCYIIELRNDKYSFKRLFIKE
jgi:hypothetical protein